MTLIASTFIDLLISLQAILAQIITDPSLRETIEGHIGNFLDYLIPFLILGPFGLWRWGVWTIRKIWGWRYQPTPTVATTLRASVITPVYKEDPDYFRRALRSYAAEQPYEIIAVIDHGDKECIEIYREFAAEDPHSRHVIVTSKPGKRAALADGIRRAKGDVVALVDSDVIWEPGLLAIVLSPFADERIGGVGTRQNVELPPWKWTFADASVYIAARIFNLYLDMRYLDEMRFLARQGNRFTCLSGRTAVYRRSAVPEKILQKLENESFWRYKLNSGDDKRLTNLVQSSGWLLRYQETARVYTHAAGIFKYQNQRLRWTRNTWRADIKTLRSKWVWNRDEPAYVLHMVDRVVMQGWTSLLSPVYFFVLLWNQNYVAAAQLFAWWLGSRALKLWPSLTSDPINWLFVPLFVVVSHAFAVQRVYAFFSMDQTGWLTRVETKSLSLWARFQSWLRLRGYQVPRALATLFVILFLAYGLNRYYDGSAVHKNQGNAYAEQGRYEEAVAEYNIALQFNPNYATAYRNRAKAYAQLGQYPEALGDFNKALTINPEDAIAYKNRGKTYADQGKNSEALADYTKSIAINPLDATVYRNRAKLYAGQGKNVEALADYGQAIHLLALPADYYNRGQIYAKEGQYQAALTDFDQVIALSPGDAASYIERGRVQIRLGQAADAIADFDKVLTLDAEETMAYRLRSIAKLQLGKVEEALTDARKVIEFDPNSPSAWDHLCRLGSIGGQAVRVLHACEKAMELDPKTLIYRDTRGLARGRSGNLQGAIEDFTAYLEWAKNNAPTEYTKYAESRQVWIASLSKGTNPFDQRVLERVLKELY